MNLDMPTKIGPNLQEAPRDTPIIIGPACTFEVLADMTLACFRVVYNDLGLLETCLVKDRGVRILKRQLLHDERLLFARPSVMRFLSASERRLWFYIANIRICGRVWPSNTTCMFGKLYDPIVGC